MDQNYFIAALQALYGGTLRIGLVKNFFTAVQDDKNASDSSRCMGMDVGPI